MIPANAAFNGAPELSDGMEDGVTRLQRFMRQVDQQKETNAPHIDSFKTVRNVERLERILTSKVVSSSLLPVE